VALIGLASGVLYLIGYVAGWAIFRNGQRARVAGEVVNGTPPDASRLALELGAYFVATALLFALYWRLLVLCRRGLLRDGRARLLALGFPVLFNAGLLFGRPYQSIDALTYVAHGFMGVAHGLNPYARAAAEVAYRGDTAGLARQLASFGWLPVHGPSPYGALWTWIELLAAATTGGVAGALVFTKVLVVLASLGCAALIWTILGRVRPEDQLLGTLVYLWNPLIVIEFAAEGHNDALMVLCVLLSLLFTVAARPALSVTGVVLGVLVKYLPIVFSPAQAIYLWRTRRGTHHLVLSVTLALVFCLLLAAALYWPFWIGADTFGAVRRQGLPFLAPTPSGALYWLALQTFPDAAAALTLRLLGLSLVAFAVFVGWRARGAAGLLRACAWISIFYLLVVSAGTWPWYAALPLALMALSPRGVFLPLALVVTFTSRLVGPFSNLVNNGFVGWDALMPVATTVSVTIPLALLLPLCVLHRARPAGKEGADRE
jgi:alpha-1,6-mannosyltransferase